MGLIMTKQIWSEQLYVTYMIVNFYIDFNQKIVSIDFTMDIGQYRNHTRVIDVNCNVCHAKKSKQNGPQKKAASLMLLGICSIVNSHYL